ncbi:MAG: lysine exporter LysO family protein [Bacteroides sp.]|nr:lysine exporter LysO family protein [Bacteroides sp.]MCM1085342.1 lysine exporter LysO family protein [Bacteroides sp.]
MRNSLLIVGCFILGCVLGWSGKMPDWMLQSDASLYILYLLMFLVGLGLGADKRLKEILRQIRPRLLLVPLATWVGTLSFCALAALLLKKWSVWECMAVGSGFAYYSLSSLLITQIKEASIGLVAAAELGTIALVSNILRELFTLTGAPLLYRVFGKFAPICAGGATTMDTTLPVITQVCGKEMVFVSIFHAILVDFSVPFLVSFFCSL